MKQLVLVTLLAILIGAAFVLPASSQTADGLDAVVTPFGVAISIADTQANFGTLPLSPADNDRSFGESTTISVNNEGSAPADLVIQGSDATPATPGEANWVLNCSDSDGTVAHNQFALLFALGSAGAIDWGQDGDSLCSSTAKTLQLGVGAPGTSDFVLRLHMPTSTDGFSTRSSTVTVTATQAN